MHRKFGFHPIIDNLDPELQQKHWELRKTMMAEELREMNEAKTPEEAFDAVIDLIVFAIGTLELFVGPEVAQQGWDRVNDANMAKERGIKTGPNVRPNPFGLPDLIKPPGWTAPNHDGLEMNHLNTVFNPDASRGRH